MTNQTTQDLTPQERIELAEAEEIEALRDIFKAEARSAQAEATMIENLVEVDKAVGYAVMGILGQGPLPTASPPKFLVDAVKLLGKAEAIELIGKAIDFVGDLFGGTSKRQKERAEQTKQSAAKEKVIKGTGNLLPSPTTTTSSVESSAPPITEPTSASGIPESQ